MKVQIELLNGSTPIPYLGCSEKSKILNNILDSIMAEVNSIYKIEDIEVVKFYIKGDRKTDSLMIRVILNFIDSEDIIKCVRDRLLHLNIPESEPGLSFMSINKSEPVSDTTMNFWYKFNKMEFLNWNSSALLEYRTILRADLYIFEN